MGRRGEIRRGAAVAWAGVGRRRVVAIVLIGMAAALAIAMAEHASAPLPAPRRTLAAVWGAILPLTGLALVGTIVPRRLEERLWGLARFGASRRRLAWGAVAVAMLLTALASVSFTAAALPVAYGGQPGLLPDLGATLVVAMVGGASYAALLCLGTTIGSRGGGRYVVLGADWWLGAGTGTLATLWPRRHLTTLAGGPPPVADLSEPVASAVVLAGLGLAAAWFAGRRLPP
ncbi:MAG: hypothetical protein AAF928_15470 [Myxococcota bacterium]